MSRALIGRAGRGGGGAQLRGCAGSKNAFSAVLSTEGRVVGPCWEKLKPKGPKGRAGNKGLYLYKHVLHVQWAQVGEPFNFVATMRWRGWGLTSELQRME